MDLQVLALAKNYTDKQIEKAEMGDIELDQSLSKSGFAADAKIVGDKFKNLQIPTIDDTLTQEGAAADAKAVGEALKNVNTSEQIQANWEQNDETAIDFIKNRTHYKTQMDFTIIENKTVEFDVTFVGETTWTGTADIKIDKQLPALIAENHIITAIINGIEWTAPVEYNSNKGILHAQIYGGETSGDGSTLDILFDQRNMDFPVLRRISITHQGETPFDYNNFTLSLYVSGASVMQIPLEYIPVDQSLNHPISQQKATDMVNAIGGQIPHSYYDLNDIPCYAKESESVFLDEVYFADNDRLNTVESNWRMSQYTMFKIKGQLYPRKQYYVDQYGDICYYYCGNGALIDNTGVAELEDTGENFVIYANAESNVFTAYYNGEIDGEYGFVIYGVTPEEVKELDERCIPDTIARVSEIPDPSNVYIGEQEPIDENIDLWLDPTAETRQPIYPPATATVGQTIVVKAVDENGVPTEWEAVDLPEGGGGRKPQLIRTFELAEGEEVNAIELNTCDDGTTFADAGWRKIGVRYTTQGKSDLADYINLNVVVNGNHPNKGYGALKQALHNTERNGYFTIEAQGCAIELSYKISFAHSSSGGMMNTTHDIIAVEDGKTYDIITGVRIYHTVQPMLYGTKIEVWGIDG